MYFESVKDFKSIYLKTRKDRKNKKDAIITKNSLFVLNKSNQFFILKSRGLDRNHIIIRNEKNKRKPTVKKI